jgi:hypothetical protein
MLRAIALESLPDPLWVPDTGCYAAMVCGLEVERFAQHRPTHLRLLED